MAKEDFDDYEWADYLIWFKDTTDCNISEIFWLNMENYLNNL